MLEVEQKIVLKRINEIRKEAGLGKINKLKRGIPRHDRACTLAMSLQGTQFNTASSFWRVEWDNNDIGKEAVEIGMAFDRGEMPELELPKTPVKIRYPGDRKATVVE